MRNSRFQNTSDAKTELEKVDRTINTGCIGWVVRIFMGKKFVSQINQTIASGGSTLSMMNKQTELAKTGKDGTAVVLGISDTGKMVNYNPIVILKLCVKSSETDSFEIEKEQIVSKIAIPRVGDEVKIKYNAYDKTELVVVQ